MLLMLLDVGHRLGLSVHHSAAAALRYALMCVLFVHSAAQETLSCSGDSQLLLSRPALLVSMKDAITR